MPRVLEIIHKYHPEVKTVVDAKRAVRVDVTSEDCAKGNKKAPNLCAMARAFEREKNYDGAIISTTVSYLIRGDKATRFMTPESVAREIISFDRHADFTPGRYTLKPPGETSTMEGKRRYNKARLTARNKKRSREKERELRQEEPGRDTGYKHHKTAGVRSL
jgi:hypothetical protein